MSAERHNPFQRLFRGETTFDFCGRWRRWFAISGTIIAIGMISLATRGLNFSIDFKGGTIWEVPTTASVAEAGTVVKTAVPALGQATVQVLTNTQTGQRTIEVSAPASITGDYTAVTKVQNALAKMAGVSANDVQLNDVGPSWGSDISDKAIKAVIVFLIVVTGYIWLRFEGKMAIAALVALVHDILLTLGIYSLSGLQVSPDTVIAFLTVLGYSLYDTIVVFDRVQENTRGLASSNRLTYSDTVNLSMNQVLARSINTSLVAVLPILSILVIGAWILGASALQDFGLALFVGLTSGAYSSIFIASPLLALLKEREPRYAEIRRRLANASGPRRLSPVAAATGALTPELAPAGHAGSGGSTGYDPDGDGRTGVGARRPTRGTRRDVAPEVRNGEDSPAAPVESPNGGGLAPEVPYGTPVDAGNGSDGGGASIPLRSPVPPRQGNRPPPRPRKKGRRR